MCNPIMLDAPVSGGVPGAEAGTLTFMVCSISLTVCFSLVSNYMGDVYKRSSIDFWA